MTQASDVHLFAWMKENAAILGSFLIVLWAMMVFWFKTILGKYYTREEINRQIDVKIGACRSAVDKADLDILREVGKVAISIKEMDARQRQDSKDNAAAHEELIRDNAKR